MLISLEIHTKTLNTRDFRHKNSQFEHFHAEYTENLGHSMRFFRKIRKLALLSIELTSKLTIWVENSKKIGFFSNTSTNFQIFFLQIITCGYTLAQKAKSIVLPHKNQGGNTSQIISTQTSTIIIENTKNSPYSSSYTIEYKIVRNSHLLSHKNWHFLKCHSNCSTNKHNLLTH